MADSISRQFDEKAAALGLKKPILPFKSICMDGQPYQYERTWADGEMQLLNATFPTAFDEPEKRLKLMGTMWWTPQKIVHFVDTGGKYHIVRDIKSNRKALAEAGYRRNDATLPYLSEDHNEATGHANHIIPTGKNKDLFHEILNTPENEQEHLIWAVIRDGSLQEVERAIAEGARIKDATYNGQPLIYSAIESRSPERDAIVRRLLPESPQGYRGFTFLHAALSASVPTHTIIPDLLKAGTDPFQINAIGYECPAFLSIKPRKETARKELRVVTDAMLQVEGVSEREKMLIKAQAKLISDALKAGDVFQTTKVVEMLRAAWNRAPAFGPDELSLAADALLEIKGLSDVEKQSIREKKELIGHTLGAGDRLEAERLLKILEKEVRQAHPDSISNRARITKQVQVFLEPLTHPKRVPEFMESVMRRCIKGNETAFTVAIEANDMVREFTSQVVLPQLLLEYSRKSGVRLTDGALREIDKAVPKLVDTLMPLVQRELFKGRSLDTIIGLDEAWHDPRTVFPDRLRPLKAVGEWHPLTRDKVIDVPTMPGIEIHVLTSSRELEEEGRAMRHCVGWNGYAPRCLKGELHVFSIRRRGVDVPLSTLDARWDGEKLHDLRNDGWSNSAPPGEAVKAVKWLEEQLKAKKMELSKECGETQESKETKNAQRPDLLHAIGFEITQENVNKAFAEYCRNPRRHARIYNPETKKFDRISGHTRLLSDKMDVDLQSDSFLILEPDGSGPKRTAVAARNIPDADIWFKGSGLLRQAMDATRANMEPVFARLKETEQKSKVQWRDCRPTSDGTWAERGQAGQGRLNPRL